MANGNVGKSLSSCAMERIPNDIDFTERFLFCTLFDMADNI
jgi:hypothetical protein